MHRTIFGALGLAAVLAACNSGAATTPITACGPPANVSTVLVYPAPNATGIPDNFPYVVLGSTAALPAYYQVYVVNNTTGNAVYFNSVSTPPNPIPTPSATPSFANPVYQSSGTPTGVSFVAGSSITVYLNNANNPNCVPATALGTFSVQ